MKKTLLLAIIMTFAALSGFSQFQFFPDAVDFGQITTGEADTVEVAFTTDISQDITLTSLAAPFSVEPVSFFLHKDSAATLTIIFAPTDLGTYQQTVTAEGSVYGEQTLAVTGEGIEANIVVTPLNFNFGEVPLSSTATTYIKISNTGTGNMMCDFTITNNLFSIPVNKLRLKESRFIKNKRKPLPEESLAVSIGLALKGLKGTKWVRTNFYQKETGLKSFLTEFKKELIITFILLFLVIISVSMTFVIKYRSKEMKIRYLNNEIKKVFKECLPGSTRVVEPVAQLKAKIKDIKKELKLFGSIGERNFTVLEILASISDNIPHDMDITIEDLNIDHEKVRLSGKADSFETVDEMKKLLANIKIFSSIKVDSLKLSADSKAVDFRITLFLIEKEKS